MIYGKTWEIRIELTPETFFWMVICDESRFPSSDPQYSSSVWRFKANSSLPVNPLSFLTVFSLKPLASSHCSTSLGLDVCWMKTSGVFTMSRLRRLSRKRVRTFFSSSCISSTWFSFTEVFRAGKSNGKKWIFTCLRRTSVIEIELDWSAYNNFAMLDGCTSCSRSLWTLE